MLRRSILAAMTVSALALVSLVLVSLALVSVALPANAQATAKDLVGTWSLVNVLAVQGDKKTEQFGPSPKGQLMFDANGRFTIVVTRADLPKYAAASRAKGTADENRATVAGSVAYFGSYTVEGSDIVYKVEGSTYPNWIGETQKRGFKLDGDTLTYTNTNPLQAGAATDVSWKRTK